MKGGWEADGRSRRQPLCGQQGDVVDADVCVGGGMAVGGQGPRRKAANPTGCQWLTVPWAATVQQWGIFAVPYTTQNNRMARLH